MTDPDKKDDLLNAAFDAYFDGCKPNIDLDAIVARGKDQRKRKRRQKLVRFSRIAAPVAAVLVALVVAFQAVPALHTTVPSSDAEPKASYTLADMTATPTEYTSLKRQYTTLSSSLGQLENSRNASAAYILHQKDDTNLIQIDILYRNASALYDGTVYLTSDSTASLPQELLAYARPTDGNYRGETVRLNGEWVTTATYINNGWTCYISVTSPDRSAVNAVLSLL